MAFPSGYQGMRWYKCDLHMHTPVDAGHWLGSLKGQGDNAAADRYIRRCYEEKLECIAVTDHNFDSMDFIPLLKDSIQRLSDEFGYKIVLFPGFEIKADVGQGMHVLAIFEPDSDLSHIDHALTNCGAPMPRKKQNGSHEPSTKRLPDIIEAVQQKDEKRLFQRAGDLPPSF